MNSTLQPSEKILGSFDPILRALGPARASLASISSVVLIRPGYRLPENGAPIPALVIAVEPGTPEDGLNLREVERQLGVPLAVIEATPDEQLAARDARSTRSFSVGAARSMFEGLLTGQEDPLLCFAPPRSGSYEPMHPPRLPLIDEEMDATICVSPEAGWSELSRFLSGVQKHLTVAMYQFTAPHIFAAVHEAVAGPGRTLDLVLHPIPEPPSGVGVKAEDLDEGTVTGQIATTLRERFRMSWATIGRDGLWASAYHIKVAVRDSDTIWLSSGNWQSSNQPAVDPFGSPGQPLPAGLQRRYNRDYHAVIRSRTLAAVYEAHIKRDLELTSAAGTAQSFSLPDLFVLEDELEPPVAFAEPPQFFPPLRLKRRVKVQPLLSPDNYAEEALKLIRSAKRSVWFQNQYINFRNTGEDFAAFQLLVAALREKVDQGLDVRIICRDSMPRENLEILIALGFPAERIRSQRACHNKTIIVDQQRVLFGSHNWSNEGVCTNRDASLLFYDEEIAEYLSQIYEYDWERLASHRSVMRQPRIAEPGDEPKPGMRRVRYSSVYED